eukprot:SAG31_NODE_1065_length_10096_cov_7.151530_7_plen_102_part_00
MVLPWCRGAVLTSGLATNFGHRHVHRCSLVDTLVRPYPTRLRCAVSAEHVVDPLLSTERADTIGMNEEVIVDGHPSCMPMSVSTIADRLSSAGWATSAYGK